MKARTATGSAQPPGSKRVARLDTSAGIRVLSRRLVLEPFLPPPDDDYDICTDGGTLVLVRPAGSTQPREVSMVLNWFAEFRRLAGQS